jgi:hypothetical protein
MRIMTIARAGALATLASLAGCGRPAGEPASTGTPTRKSGLWEQVLTRDGKPGKLGGLKICLDAASDLKLGVFGRHFAKGECQKSISRDATGAYHFSSSCTLKGGELVSTRGTATGDFTSRYDVQSDISVSGSPVEPMNGMHSIHIIGHYRGPCPAGMRPGDINLGSGMKINIDQLPAFLGASVGS